MLSPYRKNARMLRPASPSKQRAEPSVPPLFPLPGDPYTEKIKEDPITRKRRKAKERQAEMRQRRRLLGISPTSKDSPTCYLCGYIERICRCPQFLTRSQYLKEKGLSSAVTLKERIKFDSHIKEIGPNHFFVERLGHYTSKAAARADLVKLEKRNKERRIL